MDKLWSHKTLSLLSIATLLSLLGIASADNPIVQDIYSTDPAPVVHDGRVYVFTGHDEDNSATFDMRNWLLFSSDDMANWQHHQSPLSIGSFSWAKDSAWAGQVIARNGKFYFYVPVRTKATGSFAIGVGVSDKITGPFKDALGAPLVPNSEIDPTVFIDDDGQAYLYWGNPNLWYAKLNNDMISLKGSPVQVKLTTAGFGARTGNADRPTHYEEGPWIYKRKGRYYLVYAADCCSENIQYSTGPSATGPWTYGGIIMPSEGKSFTNHPGIVDYQNRSYFFYHNGALPGGGGYARSVAVESFQYNADGSIPKIRMTTGGPQQIKNLNPYSRRPAATIAWSEGIETENGSDGGVYVSHINNGDYIKVKGVQFNNGAKSFTASVASANAGGKIELRLGSVTGTLVGSAVIQNTGGWQQWKTVSSTVSGAVGIQDLFIRFTGSDGYLFNVDWWEFSAN